MSKMKTIKIILIAMVITVVIFSTIIGLSPRPPVKDLLFFTGVFVSAGIFLIICFWGVETFRENKKISHRPQEEDSIPLEHKKEIFNGNEKGVYV